ncbi:MAG: helix-turn-helix domain-containing protein [Planctomycetes bacterium]|nr:helix-turn-helix domain-containing protein [Planctomycetota bacterium]
MSSPGVLYERKLTTKQAAQLLCISESEIKKLLREGNLQAYKVGRKWVIPESSLEAYLQSKLYVPAKVGVRPYRKRRRA